MVFYHPFVQGCPAQRKNLRFAPFLFGNRTDQGFADIEYFFRRVDAAEAGSPISSVRQPMPQIQRSAEFRNPDSLFSHCLQDIVQPNLDLVNGSRSGVTDGVFADLPESVRKAILLSRGHSTVKIDSQDAFRRGEEFEHGYEFQLIALFFEEFRTSDGVLSTRLGWKPVVPASGLPPDMKDARILASAPPIRCFWNSNQNQTDSMFGSGRSEVFASRHRQHYALKSILNKRFRIKWRRLPIRHTLQNHGPFVFRSRCISYQSDYIACASDVYPPVGSKHREAHRPEFHTFVSDSQLQSRNRVSPNKLLSDLHGLRLNRNVPGVDGIHAFFFACHSAPAPSA
jgi:hypothetical protein